MMRRTVSESPPVTSWARSEPTGSIPLPAVAKKRSGFETTAWFVMSTAVICWTLNVALIATWVFIWAFTLRYGTSVRATQFLIFFVGFYFFYPNISTVFLDIHEQTVILALFLIIFVMVDARIAYEPLAGYPTVRVIFWAWLAWGIVAYAPVFYANVIQRELLQNSLGNDPILATFDRGSSVIKSAALIIISPIALLIPLASLRRKADYDMFWSATIYGTIILCVLSLLRYALNIDFIPQEYMETRTHGFRLSGFSIPDANGFGRLLVLPIVMITSLWIRSRGRFPVSGWIALALAVTCAVMTFSRTTYIALLVTMLFMGLNRAQGRTFVLFAFLAATVGLVTGATEVASYFLPGADRANIENFEGRLDIFRLASEIVLQNPLFGAWPGGYSQAMFDLGYVGGFSVTDGRSAPSAHNMLLNVATEWGAPMALMMVTILIATIVYASRTLRRHTAGPLTLALASGAAAFSVAMAVNGLTEPVAPYILFFNLGLVIATNQWIKATDALPPQAPPVPVRQAALGSWRPRATLPPQPVRP